MGTFIKWGVRPNGCPIVQYTFSHAATMKVLVPLGWLKLEVDPTKVLAHALTQMDKEIHYKKERNLDSPFHCTTAIQRWEARS